MVSESQLQQNSRVSIIIPNFNRAELIKETLRSIQNQCYENWEAIVVDDGSTDTSTEVVTKFAADDSRIKLIVRPHGKGGAPVCRNIGISASSGDFIIFLDSDDLLAPWCLQERIKLLNEIPDLDFAVFPMLCFESQVGDSKKLWNKDNGQNDLYRFISLDIPWQTTCPIWKRKAVELVGEWDEDAVNWQDWDYHVRALVLGLKYTYVNTLPDCFIRRNDQVARISLKKPHEKQIRSRLKLFSKIYRQLEIHHLLSEKVKLLFVKHFLLLAEQIIIHRIKMDFWVAFEPIEEFQLLSASNMKRLKLYLTLFSSKVSGFVPPVRSSLYKSIRMFLPKEIFNARSSHLKLEIEEREFQSLLAKLRNHSKTSTHK